MGIVSVGCNPITKEEISGVYVCSQDGVVDTIVLNKSGTFDQTITFSNTGRRTLHGRWTLYSETVTFDSLYESFEINRANGADVVIPPQIVSGGFLWIQKGRLQMDVSEVFPVWKKQATNTHGGQTN